MNLNRIDTQEKQIELIDMWVKRKNNLKSYMFDYSLCYNDRTRAAGLYIGMIRRLSQLEKFNKKIDLRSLFY